MDETALTRFERDVLEWILRGDDCVQRALRQQVAAASVSNRRFTGVGFYVDFIVPDNISCLDESLGAKPDFAFGNVGAIFEDTNTEVGFVLFVRGGRIHTFEGYTYGDEPWPEGESKYRLFYLGEPGTLGGGTGRTP